MKRKLLLGLGLLLGSTFAKAQWASPASTWTYGFTGATAATVSTAGTYLSTDASPFLAAPSSGIVRVGIPTSSNATFTVDPTANTLATIASSSGSSKFSAYNIANATEVMSITFTIRFEQTGATKPANNTAYVFSSGYNNGTSTLYSNSNAVYTSTNSNGNLFSAIRFLYNNTNDNFVLSYRTTGTTSAGNFSGALSGGALVPNTNYKIEVYQNNSSADKTYSHLVGSTTTQFTVLKGCYHLWVTNLDATTPTPVRYLLSGNYDLPKAVETGADNTDLSIPENKKLDAFLIQGSANTGNYSRAILKGAVTLKYNESVLPVSLTSFTGKQSLKGIALNWQSASELNNNYYEVLRSENGKDYASIGIVKGGGTNQEVHNYNFVDVNPVNGVNYYQLKQVDYNGTNTLVGKTLAITFGNNLSEFKVSSNGNTLKVFSSVNKTGLTNFVITDLQGKTVAQVSKVLDKGYNSFSIDVSSLKTGVFVAQMRNENEYKIAKFIKE